MRVKGKITSWNDDKGFGFIKPLAGGKRVFIHISALSNRSRRPELDEVITYSVSTDKQGRPCAAAATLAGDKLTKKEAKKSNKMVVLFAIIFVAAVGLAALSGSVSRYVAIVYAFLSLATFIAYYLDKSAAKRGAWRTSEGTLLFLGLAGGWPGALIAQQTLRHKSKKALFRAVFWITVLINCAALAWLHTESGQETVRRLIV